eukprot:6210457-Pleurochrysis_carterae.AAC.3
MLNASKQHQRFSVQGVVDLLAAKVSSRGASKKQMDDTGGGRFFERALIMRRGLCCKLLFRHLPGSAGGNLMRLWLNVLQGKAGEKAAMAVQNKMNLQTVRTHSDALRCKQRAARASAASRIRLGRVPLAYSNGLTLT